MMKMRWQMRFEMLDEVKLIVIHQGARARRLRATKVRNSTFRLLKTLKPRVGEIPRSVSERVNRDLPRITSVHQAHHIDPGS